MNEETPPALPQKMPQPKFGSTPGPSNPPPDPPNFWGMFGLGVLLVIVSCILCGPFRSLFPFGLGALAALVSVFIRGYRGIFLGYIATIGVVLLGLALICGAMMGSNGGFGR